MKQQFNRILSFLLAVVLCVGIAAPAVHAEPISDQFDAQPIAQEETVPVAPGDGPIADIAVSKYLGDEGALDGTSFLKISHPYTPASKMEHDPVGSEEEKEAHSKEAFADGLLDYLGKRSEDSDTADLGIPYVDEGANGQGDRGQTYCWSGFATGDWMYVSTQFNSAGATGDILGHPSDPENAKKTFGQDYFTGEPDGGNPGGTLSKINVKTGEVKVIMSKAKNGLDVGFRAAVEYHGKLYFCGSVNHLPTIFEVDPKNDAFQCIYQDESMLSYPGGLGAAWKEARARKICPSIRGLTTFNDYLVISTVGMDANPYIAVSNDPSSGKFTKIASTWQPDEVPEDLKNQFPENSRTNPGELFGYAACKLHDSIVGGSIWEMVEFNDKLYVAICTGTPDNAPDSHENKKGEKVIDTMQSFALVVGEFDSSKSVDDPSAWTWRPLVGDQERDHAPYTFGIDPERHRSAACNLVVFKDHLYIGEYNDTQISFMNMQDQEFDFLCRNLEESVSLYRLGADEKIEKVMGHATELFPTPIAGSDDPKYAQRDVSGFGRQENQYIWQSKVFNGKLYLGTFDETSVLKPIGKMAASQQTGINDHQLRSDLDAVAQASASDASVLSAEQNRLFAELAEAKEFYETRKQASTFREFVASTATDSFVLLPSAIFENSQVIEVNSPDSLYMALLSISDLMQGNDSWNLRESLAAKVQLTQQCEAVCVYMETTDDEIPAVLAKAAENVTSQKTEIKNLQDVLRYMENAIYGFDMYVTEDGVNFQHLTRSGMGDPYNQGLRVFAANNDPENPWMTIGTANPFYGTQVWRMEMDGQINREIIDPHQFDVAVRFVTENDKPINREWDKADTIFVVDGTETVNPADISVLFPESRGALSKEPVAIETDPQTGVKFITVKLTGSDPDVPTHTLTFETNGGSELAPIVRDEGSEVALTEFVPTKEGYTFAGWFTEAELVNKVDTVVMDADKTVYAKWDEITYTLTFETNGGSAIDPITDKAGTVVELNAYQPTKEGYTFAGWFSDEALAEAVTAVTLDANKTIYAKWDEITYTLTFETNGGSALDPIVSKDVIDVDLSKYVPTREGFLFAGWFAEAELKTALETVTLDHDITVYANWEQDNPEHTLHFETNGGTTYSDLIVEDGATVDLSEYKPTREGYVFDGWFTEAEFVNKVESVTVNADMTVYAKWDEIVKYTLSFNTNGGNTLPDVVRDSGTVVDLTAYKPTKEGNTFAGWFADSELTIPVTQVTLDRNVTVYAAWTPITYTLTFETNEGSTIEDAVFNAGAVVDLSTYVPTRKGHTFAGWYTDAELTNEIKSITMDANKTVYAKWIPVTYTLTFHTNGGSKLEPITRKHMSVVDLADYIPVKVDNTFVGWFADEALTQKVTRVTLDENKDVYAKWEKIPEVINYTLTFETNGGSKLGNVKGQPGTVVDLSGYIPVRENFAFIGWFADEALTEQVTEVTLTEDTTVYAKWEQIAEIITYTLTFNTNGGSVISSLDCTVGTVVDLSGYIPVREGHRFLGWYADSALTSKVDSVQMNQDTTVYAKWEKVTDNCILTFETNGGSSLGSVQAQPGTVVELKNYIPVRDGFKFVGWFADKALTEQVTKITLTEDTTVYAKWEEAPEVVTHTLTFNTNGGSELPNIQAHDGVTVNLENYIPFKDGYDFRGWYLEAAFKNQVTSVTMTEDVTVYAKWTIVNPFIDVPANAYYKDAVLWAVENKITTGTSYNKFSPLDFCTRGQQITFLWREEGKPALENQDNPFSDVALNAYYRNAVLWAVENDIATGTSATTFEPKKNCTRAEAVMFLWRLAGCPEPETTNNPFKDVRSGRYYYKAVLWATENGITKGTSDTTFEPNAKCNRAQTVTYLYRFAQQK